MTIFPPTAPVFALQPYSQTVNVGDPVTFTATVTGAPAPTYQWRKNGVDIAYAIPSEGASLWVDTMAIPKDAPHLAEAHAFIDFLMRPEIIAEISNKVAYANANAAATPLVAAEVRDDPGVYPSDAVKARLFTLKLLAESERRRRTRAWTKITTSQ